MGNYRIRQVKSSFCSFNRTEWQITLMSSEPREMGDYSFIYNYICMYFCTGKRPRGNVVRVLQHLAK
jgi:hypothetical protein